MRYNIVDKDNPIYKSALVLNLLKDARSNPSTSSGRARRKIGKSERDMLNKGFVMHFFWCAIMSCLISLPLQAALTRSDLIAINSIEKEINNFLVRKPVHWQQQVQARINQLEKQYVVKGYKQQNVNALKN